MSRPKVLLLDVETAPILGHVWSLWENNVALNQIEKDWHLLSWAAKWLGDPESKIMYQDQRAAKNIEDDKGILKGIWNLLDEADVIVTQNGKRFDEKKLNARFILNGMKPPSPFKHVDPLEIAKKKFGFTSNKLEYMSGALCPNHKKYTHKAFPGHELWKECLAGNLAAWKEMARYNKQDVLALEAVYNKFLPWHQPVNFNLYADDETPRCNCGSTKLECRGYAYTLVGKFQRYQCQGCGAWTRGRKNLFGKGKRESLRNSA